MFEIIGPGINMDGDYVEGAVSVPVLSINHLKNIIEELCNTSNNLISQSNMDKTAALVQRKRVREILQFINNNMSEEYTKQIEEIQKIFLEEPPEETPE